jgi:chemotaxis protein CheC
LDLTTSETDALTELINIGYARAAGALSDLTGHRITLEVPNVAVHPVSELSMLLQRVITGQVASVNQSFGGPIAGNAILLLDKSAALLLNRLLTDRPASSDLDGAAREVIAEVGNIVLNACLGVFGNLLQVQVTFSVPDLYLEDLDQVLASMKLGAGEIKYALMIRTRFYLRTSDVSGYLVIILGVASLERLLLELKKWEERQLA